MKKWLFVIFSLFLAFGFSKFDSINAAGSMFLDVPANHWARGAIDFSASKGFVGGYPDGTFRPSGTITRAEFTVVLVRIAGVKSAKSDFFTDVGTYWAKGAIQSAAAASLIIAGDYGAKFEPNKAISRLEMARMIARALAQVESYKAYLDSFDGLCKGDLPFVDYRDIQDADLPLIALTYGARIMNGYPDASFGLNNNATRAEAVVMLKSFYDNKGKEAETFQYLRELKEVAETGMNSTAVSNLIPQVNVKTDNVVVEHSNFTAKLKRLYVIPIEGNQVSLFERKFLWERGDLEDRFINGKSGYVIGVLEIEFRKSGDRTLYSQYLYLSPSAVFSYQEPFNRFNFLTEYRKFKFDLVKGSTEEIVLYGYYNNDYFDVGLQTNNAKSGGWYNLLFNSDKIKG